MTEKEARMNSGNTDQWFCSRCYVFADHSQACQSCKNYHPTMRRLYLLRIQNATTR